MKERRVGRNETQPQQRNIEIIMKYRVALFTLTYKRNPSLYNQAPKLN